MGKGSKHVHDNRYTHADRAEIYESLVKNPKSTLASPEQYARIPLKGMPSPTGKVYRDDKEENEVGKIIKRMCDGEPKNINSLTEIPESQMRLYGFSGAFKSAFFDTEAELIEYVKTHNTQLGSICVMDYLGNVAGCSDVIRLTYKSGKQVLYTSVNEDGYGIYNNERSIYKGEFVWEYNHGSIREMYSAFRNRGIVFEDDTYAKIDEYYKKIMDMCEDRQICNGNKRKSTDEGTGSTEKQKFDVLAVPCRRPFVVAPGKAEAFKNSTNSKEDNEQVREMAETFRKNNLVEEGPTLVKRRKPTNPNNKK